MSVCMLPLRQKPKDPFMAPTYLIGGSDCSHTRQGGIILKIIMLVFMVKEIFGENSNKERENSFKSVFTGFSINFSNPNSFKIEVLSTPKVLLLP